MVNEIFSKTLGTPEGNYLTPPASLDIETMRLLYTGYFSPCVILALLHLQTVLPFLKYVHAYTVRI